MNHLNKLTLTLVSVGLLTSLTACNKNTTTTPATTASTVASTVVVTPATASSPSATLIASQPKVVASTVIVNASAPAPSPTALPAPVTPASADANASTKDVTAPTQSNGQPTTANSHTPLQADLITLLATGQNLQKDAMQKQASMEKTLQQKAKTIKTAEDQRQAQKALLTDVIAYKTQQKQQLQSVPLTEPRVIAVRDKMVSSLNSDIKATQIVLNNPEPTAQTKKSFTNEMKKMEADNTQAAQQLQKLLKEAGMAETAPKGKAKK